MWGGEKALLELAKTLSEERNDITIYMIRQRGGLLELIPDSVKYRCQRKFVSIYDGLKMLMDSPDLRQKYSQFTLKRNHE